MPKQGQTTFPFKYIVKAKITKEMLLQSMKAWSSRSWSHIVLQTIHVPFTNHANIHLLIFVPECIMGVLFFNTSYPISET